MSKMPAISAAEIEIYAKRHGLTNFAPEHLARLAELAEQVAETSRALPRLASKSDEPAHVFRAPQK